MAASVRARLLNFAKARGQPFDLVLTRFALERLLYRLAEVPAQIQQWTSFVEEVAFQLGSLAEVVGDLAAFLMPHAAAARMLDNTKSAQPIRR
jgi:hypothetical protein